jgi:hypothetical protein
MAVVDLGARMVAACRALAVDLTEAGVPADVERARVNPGGAWVAPQTVDLTTLSGSGTVRVHVILVAADNGDVSSHLTLAGLLDVCLSDPVRLVPAEPVDTGWAVVLPHSQTPFPAYRLPVDLDL